MVLDDDLDRIVKSEREKFIKAGLTERDYIGFFVLRDEFQKSCPSIDKYISDVLESRAFRKLNKPNL
jgi:hypothetical protein